MRRPSSRRSLNGQIILITGAAGGIGRATAEELRRRGAMLMLSDVDEQSLYSLAGAIGAASHPCDTTDLSQCERLVARTLEHYGRIDIVWANAGVSAYGPLDLIAPSTAAHVIGVNLLGSHNTIRAALPAIIDARG